MNFDRIPLSRRNLLKVAGISALASTGVACSQKPVQPDAPLGIINDQGERVLPWSNWSGNQSCQPNQRWVPRHEDELIQGLRNSQQGIRMVGAGHSFSALVPTDQTLLSLARLRGIEQVDHEQHTATVWGGTRLSSLGQALWQENMSLINMSDIDSQSFSGAIATSTHGTGKHLGSMSTQVQQMRIVNAHGEVIDCSQAHNTELLQAAGNHLGALGVISQATIRTEPAYYLREHSWMMSEEEGLARAEELRDGHRHYEMFALPNSKYMLGITIDKIDASEIPADYQEPAGDAYEAFRMMSNMIDYMPFARSWLVNYGASTVKPETRYGQSNDIFGNVRDIRFNEMEYVVPADVGPACLREILATIKKQRLPIIFPIEARYVQADDIWLSPFYQRDGFAISCHNFHDKDYKRYFAAIEPIFWKYDGRPHWGKIHSLKANEMAARYDRFDDFKRVRNELDPHGRFLNDHLKALFGIA